MKSIRKGFLKEEENTIPTACFLSFLLYGTFLLLRNHFLLLESIKSKDNCLLKLANSSMKIRKIGSFSGLCPYFTINQMENQQKCTNVQFDWELSLQTVKLMFCTKFYIAKLRHSFKGLQLHDLYYFTFYCGYYI